MWVPRVAGRRFREPNGSVHTNAMFTGDGWAIRAEAWAREHPGHVAEDLWQLDEDLWMWGDWPPTPPRLRRPSGAFNE